MHGAGIMQASGCNAGLSAVVLGSRSFLPHHGEAAATDTHERWNMAVASMGRCRSAFLRGALAHFRPGSFGWQGIATTATLLMTLFIRRSEHRDTQAVQAKLDELLRANGEPGDHLISLDDKEPEQVEEFRSEARRRPFWLGERCVLVGEGPPGCNTYMRILGHDPSIAR
jgi:hypothetical protein